MTLRAVYSVGRRYLSGDQPIKCRNQGIVLLEPQRVALHNDTDYNMSLFINI